MPKIGTNKVNIDPKAYAARLTAAKKRVAAIDPATKTKLEQYYPKVKKETIVNKALDPKRGKKAAPAKPAPLPKKPLRGPDAIKEYQRQVSPKGVKKTESGAKKGLDKKYPGLYKKSK
jgi:hypothetical protein